MCCNRTSAGQPFTAKKRKQPFTLQQIADLLKAAEGGDWAGLIRVAFYSGARLENCANLRFRDLDFTSDQPVIVFEKYAKHGDEHRVPMHSRTSGITRGTHSNHAARESDPVTSGEKRRISLFPSLAGRRVTNLSKEFRKLMAAAGIENRKVREAGKGAARDVWALGFHSFRRTNVSLLANAGVSEERRMAITAHATRDVHKGYTHHDLARLGEAVALLPSL